MKILYWIRTASDRLTTLYLNIASVFMVVLCFACFMQVLTRYVLNSSLAWTEELARYSFIWMIMTGASAGFRKGALVVVDNLHQVTKGVSRLLLDLLTMMIVFGMGYILLRYGIELITLVGGFPSVTMRVPMGLVHAASPVCGVGLMLGAIAGAVDSCEEYRGGGKPT